MYLPTRTATLDPPADPAPPATPTSGERSTPQTGDRASGASGSVPHRPRWRRLDRNVYLLGLTSLLTDVASEMVTVVLPLYLVATYGLGTAQLGAFDGLYTGVAAVVCVAAALTADRRRRHKRVAATGYALSVLAKLGLLLTVGRWVPMLACVTTDRLGKGIRTAPRDAIISLSVRRERLGEAFGVHRALDTVGAVAGPIVAAVILARDPAAFNAIFAIAFFISLLGLAVIVLLVDDRRVAPPPAPVPEDRPSARRSPAWSAAVLVGLARDRRFRPLWSAAVVLALATPGEVLIFLALQRQAGIGPSGFALLFVGASLVFLLAAIPLGRLADRLGRRTVFVAGELALAASLALVALGATTGPVPVVVLLGIHLAATEGVLAALVSERVPADIRTTGLAVVITSVALARVVGSFTFGALWAVRGLATAAAAFTVALTLASAVAWWLLRASAAAGTGHGTDVARPRATVDGP